MIVDAIATGKPVAAWSRALWCWISFRVSQGLIGCRVGGLVPPLIPMMTTSITRVEAMDPAEFGERFVELSVPVVLTGATAAWPAVGKWSHSWFERRFGDRVVQVSSGSASDAGRDTMALRDYLSGIAGVSGSDLPYLRLHRLPGAFPELSEDFVVPTYCPPTRNTVVHLWIGPKGTVQHFHKDNQNPLSPVHNLFVQIWGRKVVSLVSADQDEKMYRHPAGSARANYSQVDYERPDLARFPLFREARIAQTVVGPGEMLFIPANTWHHVRSLEPSVSLNFWWYRTTIADVVATLAADGDVATRRSPIDVADVDEFGGIWPFALAARTLPVARRARLADSCTDPVARALVAALDRLGRDD